MQEFKFIPDSETNLTPSDDVSGFSFTPDEVQPDLSKIKEDSLRSADGSNIRSKDSMDLVIDWAKNVLDPKTAVGMGMRIAERVKPAIDFVKNQEIESPTEALSIAGDVLPEVARGATREFAVNTPKIASNILRMVGTNVKSAKGDGFVSTGINALADAFGTVSEYMGDIEVLKPDQSIMKGSFAENPSWKRFGNVIGGGAGQALTMGGLSRIGGHKLAYGFYALAGGAEVFQESYEKDKDVGKANTLAALTAASTYMIDRWIDPLPDNIAKGAKLTSKQVIKEMAKAPIKEVPAETLQQVYSENLVRKIGVDATQDLYEGLVESAIGALGGAGTMATVSGTVYAADRAFNMAKERALEKGATEEEISAFERATMAKLEKHPEAFETVFQQNVQQTINDITKFAEENGNPAEVRKAMQTKADLEEVYNKVFEILKTKENENVASAQAKIIQGVALWGSQELGISPIEYMNERFPNIEKVAYKDFMRSVRERNDGGLGSLRQDINRLKRGVSAKSKDTRKSLSDFIKEQGGIRDDRGDIKIMEAKGLLNENGVAIDEMTRLAWDAGYLQGETRPEINQLLDALDRDVRGNKVYSINDEMADVETNRRYYANLSEAIDRAGGDINVDDAETILAKLKAYEESLGVEETPTLPNQDFGDFINFQRDLFNNISKIDAERLSFERKDINPELRGRENEVVKAVAINRFFADRKSSKEISVEDVVAKIDETVGKNENGVRVLKNSVTGETVTLSNNSINKMFDTTAIRDGQNIGGILGKECIANIRDIFNSAILVKTHDDNKRGTKNRIRRYANVINSEGENFIVKITVKELANNRKELTDFEIESNDGKDLANYDLKVGRKNTAANSLGSSEVDKSISRNSGNDIIIDDLIEFVNTYTEKTININGVERQTTNSEGQRIAKTVEGLQAFYKWFGDSKVVDEQGRPLVVYHGTNKEFDSFDKKLLGTTTLAYSARQGFFFTDSEDVANSYGDYAAIYQPINELRKKQEMAERWGDWDTVDELTIKIEELDRKISQTPANERGQKIYPVYLKADNVLEYDAKDEYFSDIGNEINDVLLKAKKQGKDGVVLKNLKDQPLVFDEKSSNHFVVFEPNQIKSTSNRGTFNPNDDRIYYQGGENKVYSVFDLKVGDSLAAFGVVEEINQTDRQIKIGGQWHSTFMLDMEANRFGLTLGPKEEIDISEDVEEEVKKVSEDRSVVEGQKPNNAEYNKIAEDYFGITNNLDLGGYILTDGNLLDLSGKKLGSDGRTRSIDHREISDAFEDNNVSMEDFINSGNIRYMPESNSILMADIPNSKQYKIIEEIINRANGQINVELMSDANNWGSFRDYSREYPDGTTLATIKRDINAFYKGEGVRQITEFYQDQTLYRDPKGAYTHRINEKSLISLFERADASTFMHETAHFFFEELKAFAKTSEKSAKMLATINEWLGSDGTEYTNEQIEQFARGFEQYLREGKAPSKYLKRAFNAFMNWLRQLYKTANELNVKLNDEVRDVYANILGGQELDKYVDAPLDEILGNSKKYFAAKRAAMDEIYKENSEAKAQERKIFNRSMQTMQKTIEGMRDYLADAIVPLEEEIKQISPDLYNMNRRLEISKLQKTKKYYERVKGFVDKAQGMTPVDFHTLDLALKNRDTARAGALMQKYGMENDFAEVRNILDELREQMIDVGVDVAYLPDYYPRVIKDADGLLDYVEMTFSGRPEYSIIQKMIEEKNKDGRIRTKEDEAQIVNSLIRGFAGGISLAKIGNVKERSIQIIDQNMNKYYKSSIDALTSYISGSVQMIENKKYFGKETKEVQNLRRMVANRETTIAEYKAMDPKEAKWKEIKTRNYKIGGVDAQIRNTFDKALKAELQERKTKLEAEVEFLQKRRAEQVKEIAINRMQVELDKVKKEVNALADSTVENSVGNLLLELAEQGKISHNQELRLKELLLARFSNKGLGNEFLRMLRDGGYIWTLGNFESAITQFGDLGTSAYKNGLWNTAFEYAKAISGKSEITIDDLGLGKVLQDGGYVDTSALSQALDKVLKYVGFEKMDKIAKQTLVNSAIRKSRDDAKANNPELEEYLRHEFGEKWVDVKEDLKTGAITDEIIEYAMFNLMDVQPITIDQMPRYYAEGGKKRLFYMMKSYFIKQLNEYRKVCFETAKKDPKKALTDMLLLTVYLMAFNAGADLLKDLLFGRPINVYDTLVNNIFIGGSINRYQAMSVKREGLFRTLQKQLLFPVMMDEVIVDVLSDKEVKNWNTWKNVPLVGRPYYWWFGGGHLKTEKEEKKLRNQRRKQRQRKRRDD